jgi:hypothetical protein
MRVLLSDKKLDQFEQSKPYMLFDFVFNWTGGIGELLLLVYILWSYWYDDHNINQKFWLKVGLLAIALLGIRYVKDAFLSWAGIAPPDYSKWSKPGRSTTILPDMAEIMEAQERANRIRERGVLVEKLLGENAARFERKSK